MHRSRRQWQFHDLPWLRRGNYRRKAVLHGVRYCVAGPLPGLRQLLSRRGEVLTGDGLGAEVSFRDAIELAERQSARLFQLRATTSLARLWCDQDKRAEARDLLGPIYNWFTEGFDAPDLRDARALLDELA